MKQRPGVAEFPRDAVIQLLTAGDAESLRKTIERMDIMQGVNSLWSSSCGELEQPAVRLATWAARRAQDSGAEVALGALRSLLFDSSVEVDHVATIYGVRITKSFQLTPSTSLQRLADREKTPQREGALSKDPNFHETHPHETLLVRRKREQVFFLKQGDTVANVVHDDNPLAEEEANEHIANAISIGISNGVYIGITWRELTPSTVFTTLRVGTRRTEIPVTHTVTATNEQLSETAAVLKKLDQQPYLKLADSIRRYRRASQTPKYRAHDITLDLAIAYESLLTEDRSSGDPISSTLALRAAWLLGNSLDERRQLQKTFRDFYDLRSQIVHSGGWGTKGARNKEAIVDEALALYPPIARKLVHERRSNRTDWTDLVLGGG